MSTPATLTTAAGEVVTVLDTLDPPVRQVGDLTMVGAGPAYIVRPPTAVEPLGRAVWAVTVEVVVVPTSQNDIAGLLTLTQDALDALAAAGLRTAASPATLQLSPDSRITVYEITVEV